MARSQSGSSDRPAASRRTRRNGVLTVSAGMFAMLVGAGIAYSLVDAVWRDVALDADYLWRPWPPISRNGSIIGMVSAFLGVVAGAAAFARGRTKRPPGFIVAQVLILLLFGAWLGAGYRVVTSGVTGANIGGGGVLLFTPFLAVVVAGSVFGIGLYGRQHRRPD